MTTAYPYSTNVWVNAYQANILLEFQDNGTAVEALEETQKYKKKYFYEGKDVLCMGIKYNYVSNEKTPLKDQVVCNRLANLYDENGTLKEYFPVREEVLPCP